MLPSESRAGIREGQNSAQHQAQCRRQRGPTAAITEVIGQGQDINVIQIAAWYS